MSLIIATGSNIGDSLANLKRAKESLMEHFTLVAQSRVYTSKAVDYEDQPDFFNQVLEFETPELSAHECMSLLLNIEAILGRTRDIDKGPRVIDIDILFYDLQESSDPHITLPHPRLFERSFVVYPLMELPVYDELKKNFQFPANFDNEAFPLD